MSNKPIDCSEFEPGYEGLVSCKGCGADGGVWGSNPYTGDSCLCAAARHCGAIGEAGGVFRVRVAPGQKSYKGSTKNGVEASDYKQYHTSMAISKEGEPLQAVSAKPSAIDCSEFEPGYEGLVSCKGCGADGGVWGSNPYTGDSCLCAAARHCGAIGEAGGVFRVSAAPGASSYIGSSRKPREDRQLRCVRDIDENLAI